MNLIRSPRVPVSRPARAWRVTTAIRVFVMAVVIGQVLSTGTLGSVGFLVLALGLLAAFASAFELRAVGTTTPWVTVVEAILAAALIGGGPGRIEPLLMYLAVPPVIAGVRHGWVTTANASLASGLTMLGAWAAAEATGFSSAQIGGSVPWLVIGAGAGLLASWQTRSVRSLEASQAPYAAAHRLVSQLHGLANRLPVGLDSLAAARSLEDRARTVTAADRCILLARVGDGQLQPLVARAVTFPAEESLASECLARAHAFHDGGTVALPLRVGEHAFGAAVLTKSGTWAKEELSELQELLDEQAVRLDTALLFDEVRALATTEERNRLARDIHDGVAQEIVSLGYLADEISASAEDAATRRAAGDLRAEITRVVGELRFSIFDLRHDVAEAGDLSGALAEYVRTLSASSDLRVHLMLDEQGPPLPRRTEAELLRIAQEAIANVRKHAHAINLWITFTTGNRGVRLVVEDDGVGAAALRDGHYGLQTMRERAEAINAELTVGPRADGGTVVSLQSRATIVDDRGEHHVDHRPARR